MPGGKGNIRPEDGKSFKKGKDERRNLNGRPRKLISDTIKELQEKGITEPSKDEIKTIYLSLLNVSIPELEEMLKEDNQSGLVRIAIKNILSGKGFDIIEKMLDRGIGKAESNIDIKSNGQSIFNDSEREARIKELKAKLKGNID